MKNNKKGFTLIELLAVIAILAILVVLAVPSVLDLFNGAKESAFETQAQSVYNAVQDRTILDQVKLSSSKKFVYTHVEGYTFVAKANDGFTVSSLELSGTADFNYCVTVENGVITKFIVSDNNYSIYLANAAGVDVSDIKLVTSNGNVVVSDWSSTSATDIQYGTSSKNIANETLAGNSLCGEHADFTAITQ